MTTHEMNPLSGGNSSLDGPSSLANTPNSSHDLFGQPLSKAPTALGTYEHSFLKSDDQANGTAHIDSLTGLPQQNNSATASYGYEFESGIPPIDYAVHLAGKAVDAIDKAVESGASVVQQATHTAVAQIAETAHQSINTVQEHWNAPDNQLRTTVQQRANQALGSAKQKVTDLAAHPDVKDAIQAATELGQTALAKTRNFIATAQSATEAWVNQAFDSSYLDRSLTPQSVSRTHSDHPFVGVIDTGFGAHSHGAQVVDVIQHSSQRSPDWLGEGVGTGHWAEALMQFVDAAKASGRPGAVVNLSFDLVQLNPDGSTATRFALTDKEQAALAYAHDNGVVIIASAGNQGGAMSALGQASQTFDNIITVGAANGTHRAAYSSYGEGLNLVAPGRASSGASNSALAGTSLAAAEVTAAITRIWAANPELNPQQVSRILESTAKDIDITGRDTQTGFGLLDQSAAVKQAKITQPQREQLSETATSKESINENSTWNSVGAIASERINSIGITVKAGDTLWGIAAKYLGDGNRWTELKDQEGNSFAPATASRLPIGTEVYLPSATQPQQSASPAASEQLPDQEVVTALRKALIGQESGGNYKAVNQDSGALGIGQILPSNVASWSRAALGREVSQQEFLNSPDLQLKIIDYKLNQYYQQAKAASNENTDIAVRRVASAWYSGQPDWYTSTKLQGGGQYPSIANYTLSVLDRFHKVQGISNSSSTAAPVFDTEQAGDNNRTPYRVISGQTLSGIAQERWGDASLWKQIEKEDGSKFTEVEARQLQAGETVYLPGVSSTASTQSTEQGSTATSSRETYTIQIGDTLGGIAQRELGSSSLWTEIKKADGSSFSESEASKLQVGQQVYLPNATRAGSDTATTNKPAGWQDYRQDERESSNSSSTSPVQPGRGSAADLPGARKALQQALDSYHNLQKLNKGGHFGAELPDLQHEVNIAQLRVNSSEAAKQLQDFDAHPTVSNKGKEREVLRQELQEQASSTYATYMASQGLDSSGQPLKLTPPTPNTSGLLPAEMSSVDKLEEAFKRSLPHLGEEAKPKLEELFTPENLAIMAGTMAAFVAAQATPVGWVLDGAGFLFGLFTTGTEIIKVGEDLLDFAKGALGANTEADLDEAGQHLADAITTVGIDVVVSLLTRKALGGKTHEESSPQPNQDITPDAGAGTGQSPIPSSAPHPAEPSLPPVRLPSEQEINAAEQSARNALDRLPINPKGTQAATETGEITNQGKSGSIRDKNLSNDSEYFMFEHGMEQKLGRPVNSHAERKVFIEELYNNPDQQVISIGVNRLACDYEGSGCVEFFIDAANVTGKTVVIVERDANNPGVVDTLIFRPGSYEPEKR
jgi:LysM repeat protein